MFVNSLEIKNLRSFESLKINLSKNINVLIGPNNSGKSTIIKSLYKLQDPHTLSRNDIRTTKHSSHILIDINNINEAEKKMFRNEKHILLPKISKALILLESSDYPEEKSSIEQNGYNYIEVSIENIYSSQSTGNFALINFLGFPTSENKNNFIYPFFSKRKSTFLNSQGGKDTTYLVTDSFQNLPAKIQKVISHPFTRSKFDRLCKDVLGFTLGIIPGEGNESKIGMYSGINSEDNPIPIESMGDGVINIIGLITILLTENGKLFLIEELENDIHPLALKKLLNLIIEKSDNNQFVISTHSNIVLKYLGSKQESKIFYTSVEYEEAHNLFSSTIKEIKNEPEIRRKALEELGYEFADYDLYEGWLFFEESSAEEIIRDYLIPWFFYNSRLRKFKTFSARTLTEVETKFEAFNKMFVYLHLTEVYKNKAYVIVDAGKEEEKIIDKFKSYYLKHGWLEQNFAQWSKHDFEEYYPSIFKEKVEEIRNSNKESKSALKAKLLHEVKDWIKENSEIAKKEFEESAKEVIHLLNTII